MSKLFKSKFLLGVMVVAVMAVAGVAVKASTASADCSITMTLRVGSSGLEVQCLQGKLGVAADGKFGPKTMAAVKAFQLGKGLSADGVVGPMTRAALMNAVSTGPLCPNGNTTASNCMTPPTGTPTGPLCPNGNTVANNCMPSGSSNGGSLSGGETSINAISVDDADDDTINEGASKAKVADIQFDVDDADAQLVRADIVFQGANGNATGGETKPWRVFEKAYLMDGSKVLATVDAGDQDNWDDADDVISGGTNQAYRIRFNSINAVYKEGSNNNDLWVAVDVASSVDNTGGSDEDWTVGVDSDGLRFTDSAGVDTFESTSDTASFSIEAAGAQSDVTVTKAASSPDAQTLEVKESSSTTATVAVFKVKADADGGDVKIDDFPVQLTIANTTTGDDMGKVVDDVFLVVDGTTYSTDTTPSATDAQQTFTFGDIEDDDVTIGAGETMDVTVKVKFKSQGSSGANYANGTTITAAAAVTASDLEDSDTGDDIGTVTGGSVSGETMTVAGNGIMVDLNSAATDVTVIDGTFNDVATFTWKFDVTAFGDNDVYINKDFADIVTSDTANDVDTVYAIEKSGGADLTSTSGTISTSTSADVVTGVGGVFSGESFYKIASGDTETFTVTVTGTNQTDNKQVRAYLADIEFTTVDVTAATAFTSSSVQHYTANLQEDSQTPFKSVQ